VANEDKAARYQRLKRRASLLGTGLVVVLVILLLVTGLSSSLRAGAAAMAGGSFTLTVVLYVLLLAVVVEIVQLPLAFYQGVTLERRYGLSTQSTGRWWLDHLKSGALGLAFGVLAAVLVWHLLRLFPTAWWIAASLCLGLVMVALAHLAPVLLLPIFYDFRPLDRPELRDRLLALANRAGARVLGVFEWRLGDRTRKANAALTGVGATRRILVSDTLLADHSDDEIEVILAHELAHHVHQDIWTGMALEAALIVLGFYVADSLLSAAIGSFGIASKSDVAALPVVLLAAGGVSLVFVPFANALSRAHERRADRYALEITGNVAAFVTAMKRLGTTNLAEERPSRLVQLLFYTHPPVEARIAAAEMWAARHPKR
jgi:STE24 endopeptidase